MDPLDSVLFRSINVVVLVIRFQEYPKLSTAYYVLLEYLAQDHISFIATLEPHVFLYILETISDGLTGQGSMPSNFTGQQLRRSYSTSTCDSSSRGSYLFTTYPPPIS